MANPTKHIVILHNAEIGDGDNINNNELLFTWDFDDDDLDNDVIELTLELNDPWPLLGGIEIPANRLGLEIDRRVAQLQAQEPEAAILRETALSSNDGITSNIGNAVGVDRSLVEVIMGLYSSSFTGIFLSGLIIAGVGVGLYFFNRNNISPEVKIGFLKASFSAIHNFMGF